MTAAQRDYAPIPTLPPPVNSAPSLNSRKRKRRLTRLAVVLVGCTGLVAVLLLLGGPLVSKRDAVGETSSGPGSAAEGSLLAANTTETPQPDTDTTLDGAASTPGSLEPDPALANLVFSPRLPCNAVTRTAVIPASGLRQEWLSPSPPLPLPVPLSARLDTWLSAPVAHSSTWARFNLQTCGNPSVRRNKNKLHADTSRKIWEEMGADEVTKTREELADVLKKAELKGRLDEWRDPGKRGTRGIVWTAGNADTFDRVLVSLRLLRHSYNSTLPATIAHFPSEHPSDLQLDAFSALNASVLSLDSLSKDADSNRRKSFHLKGAALVEAPYDEVLLLDSDNIPVRDPAVLWDSPEFRTMGVLLWPDYFKDQPENAIWSILGVQCRDEWTTEAGQLLVRKSQHLDALLLVEYMLQDWHRWFSFSDGDKDLFRYALLALRKRWAVPSVPLSAASWLDPSMLGKQHEDEFAGHTMLQYGMASEEGGQRGRALFVHANLLKRIASEFKDGDTWGRTLRLRLPTTSSYASSTPPPASSPFIFQADDLVNVSPFTGLGLPASLAHSTSPSSVPSELDNPALIPIWARQRALLARGLSMHFWAGHRRAAYVLAVETAWTDELASLATAATPAAAGVSDGASLDADRPWEKEEMEQSEWEEWRAWVEREREAQCTARADVEVPLPTRGGELHDHNGGEDDASAPGGHSREPPRRESLRSTLLSAAAGRPPPLLDPLRPPPDPTAQQDPQPDEREPWMEIALWADDADLRGFERRYYEVGKGKATGSGFRARE